MAFSGEFDVADLLGWAERNGHPEGWVKRAQAAHLRADNLYIRLLSLADAVGAGPRSAAVSDELYAARLALKSAAPKAKAQNPVGGEGR